METLHPPSHLFGKFSGQRASLGGSDLSGYRVWRQATTSSLWEQVTCQYIFCLPTRCQDGTQDNRTNYEYYVVSVDLAGIESAQSNHVTV